jgi:hypothetical protein
LARRAPYVDVSNGRLVGQHVGHPNIGHSASRFTPHAEDRDRVKLARGRGDLVGRECPLGVIDGDHLKARGRELSFDARQKLDHHGVGVDLTKKRDATAGCMRRFGESDRSPRDAQGNSRCPGPSSLHLGPKSTRAAWA